MTPSGTICICANTNLKYQSEDTIVFASESAKRTYFDSKVIKTFTDQMYTRSNTNGVNSTMNGKLYVAPGTSSVKVNCPIGQIYNADYMFYVDSGYSGKTFYNFITDVSYVSDAVTLVTFTEDVFMTWQNNISLNKTYVERETTDTDTRYNLDFDIPDFIEGEIREYNRTDIGESETTPRYICLVLNRYGRPVSYSGQGLNLFAITTAQFKWYGKNQKRVDGFTYIYLRADMTSLEQEVVSAYVEHVLFNGTTDPSYEILGIYSVPRICVPSTISNFLDGRTDGAVGIVTPLVPTNVPSDYSISNVSVKSLAYSGGVRNAVYTPSLPSLFDGYVPKNNKLYSSPYCYYILTNNQGTTIKLKPQYFNKAVVSGIPTPQLKFQIFGTNGVFANVDAFPVGYMNTSDVKNNDYKLSISNYPDVAFSFEKARDYRWNKIGTEMLSGITSSLLTGASEYSKGEYEKGSKKGQSKGSALPVLGDLIGTAINVGQDVGLAKWDLPEVRGLDTSGESATSEELMKFSIVSYGLDRQSAEAIDSKFTKYGYAIGKIKAVTLGLNGRKRFHYVKTSECNIIGSVPMYAKNYLNERFDNGIRMWSSSYYLTDIEDNPLV